jgi:uncharacterized C2H2 Zn-finger protein
MVEYTCEKCNKVFNRKSNYEVHLNKKIDCRKNKIDVKENITNGSSKIEKLEENNKITPPITSTNTSNTNKDDNNHNKCTNCNKIFTRTDNYNRHVLFRCKYIEENNKDDNKVLELLTQMNNKIEDLQNKNSELQTTIQELKEQKTSSNIINNTNSNNTINNNNITFNIIKFGDESPAKKLTTKEIQYIINAHRNTMLQRSIEITHFNNKHPEFQNVYIADKKMQNANIYNGDKFDLKSIDFVIDDLILHP